MYNGIGLQTARGSGTNGYVQRNLSAVRQTKEKVPDYQENKDAAVRPFDPELVEHDRRRQAEVSELQVGRGLVLIFYICDTVLVAGQMYRAERASGGARAF